MRVLVNWTDGVKIVEAVDVHIGAKNILTFTLVDGSQVKVWYNGDINSPITHLLQDGYDSFTYFKTEIIDAK